ncbi:N-acetylmuramoyl-L-alanine amidase [Aneurinibacillus thermoaerophilus]|uniref:N-acetylmuramoyl-L-alanine amidase n=1 Tax=Aneurinibacillus thermoaerophilus TaxID=143495 RepID=UPI002E1EDC40|nr:N-acetylmuramoyl-L-alanine amidase [Aneurinibacillus thermoaerophilus]MED0762767.1 N-acetylmuramoyl-L-alanine amidase [Aneurinibacillus thermoaerophilus]
MVVLDYGHGLPDPGACGCGLEEYKVAAELGSAVKMHLERHNVKVVLTRMGPHSLSLARDLKQNKREDLNKRVSIANAADADLFVSFHLNSGGGSGYETLCYSIDERVRAVHDAVAEFLKDNNVKDRGMKVRTDLAVLKCKPKAVLLECLFIDNPKDMELMKNPTCFNGFAEAIAKDILTAIGIKYVPLKKSEKKGEAKMKQADAEKIIAYLQAAWKAATCPDEKKEIGRLADEVRVAAGMKKVNS